jgi:tRNA modification GTPase
VAIAGTALRFIDTAGLRESPDTIEQLGVARAQEQVVSGDIVLWLGAAGTPPHHPHVILVHARCDLPDRFAAPPDSHPCSAINGHGVTELIRLILGRISTLVPALDAIALNRRQADQLSLCVAALRNSSSQDIVLAAEALRSARGALDGLSGHAGVEQVLDALFGRFCLGK